MIEIQREDAEPVPRLCSRDDLRNCVGLVRSRDRHVAYSGHNPSARRIEKVAHSKPQRTRKLLEVLRVVKCLPRNETIPIAQNGKFDGRSLSTSRGSALGCTIGPEQDLHDFQDWMPARGGMERAIFPRARYAQEVQASPFYPGPGGGRRGTCARLYSPAQTRAVAVMRRKFLSAETDPHEPFSASAVLRSKARR